MSALLRGDSEWPDDRVFTTGHGYLRLCQAVVRGAGGARSGPGAGGGRSGPVLSLPASQRERAVGSILELPDAIEMLSWRIVAPVMASRFEGAGKKLNLLSREALAAALVLGATVVMAPGNENHLLRQALREIGLA